MKISTFNSNNQTADPGEYKVVISTGNLTETGTITLRADPDVES